MEKHQIFFRKIGCFLTGVMLTFMPFHAQAATLSLSNIPLEVKEGVPANIILTLDDSGSMAWGFLPDEIGGYCPGSTCMNIATTGDDNDLKRATSSSFNKIYYNPEVTYTPPAGVITSPYNPTTFTKAYENGFDTSDGTVDLSTDYYPTWANGVYTTPDRITAAGYSGTAFYHKYDPIGTSCNPQSIDNNDCYVKVEISSTTSSYEGGPNRTDCTNAPICSFAEESQNFANWYSFYRTRILLAKTAAWKSFSRLSNNIRIGYQGLNRNKTIIGPQAFTGTFRDDFFSWIRGVYASGSTPLRKAFARAGGKYSTDAAYEKDPGVPGTPKYSCRQNFHFAFTDGAWNGSAPGSLNGQSYGNVDGTSTIALPETVLGENTYTARAPYEDANSKYLADIAMFFWINDLHTLNNNVPQYITDRGDYDSNGSIDDTDLFWNPANDPATWQHMVNFTIGFGVSGDKPLTETIDTSTTWTNNHVDDLWHAAINSRGRYFNASNPIELVDTFNDLLDEIEARKGSSSALATTSSQYQTGTLLFQAIYDTSDWSGDIIAMDVKSLNTQWSVSKRLEAQVNGTGPKRRFITSDGSGSGVAFKWDSLTNTQKTALDTLNSTNDGKGQDRIAYLRGDTTKEEKNGGVFRNRSTLLGDVVHSDPIFVPPPGPPLYYYPDNLETEAYSTWSSSKQGRTEMLVFGANDGMLHILNAKTGDEILAYVPSMVYKNLSKLTDPGYKHEFFVNQPISVWDVYAGGWKTVAIGGLGKGGQGIFALDITDPDNLSEDNAGSIVMWEFTDTDDPDLGYTYTKPYMMRMNNGKWMVAFGNGYNADEADGNITTNGDALLFLLDIETGGKGATGLLKKLSTQTGFAEDPTGQKRANRLTDIAAVDTDGNFTVDLIYAGDLFGNLWKFDVRDSDPNNWSVITDNGQPKPLFVARDAVGNPQPITIAPAIQYHRQKRGYLVYFGTGKYVEDNDPADTSLQTFYAVWDRLEDNDITTIYRQHLLQQKIEGVNTSQFTTTEARLTSNEIMNWYNGSGLPSGAKPTEYLGWYLDLAEYDNSKKPIQKGERLYDEIYVFGNRVEFQTLIPSTNPCESGGESWIFALNAMTGSRFLTASPWDYNNDGTFNSLDKVEFGTGKIWGSGIRLKRKGGIFRRTKLLSPSDCREVNILNMADGSLGSITGNCMSKDIGRRSWQELNIQ